MYEKNERMFQLEAVKAQHHAMAKETREHLQSFVSFFSHEAFAETIKVKFEQIVQFCIQALTRKI